MSKIIKNQHPENYDALRKSANRMSNWRERLDAIEQLGLWKHQRSIDVLTHKMNNDPVSRLREAAFNNLKILGEDVQLPPKKMGELIKDTTKVLTRIKKSLPKNHTHEQFKEKLKNMRLDIYDTYEGEMGADFDEWLESAWKSIHIK